MCGPRDLLPSFCRLDISSLLDCGVVRIQEWPQQYDRRDAPCRLCDVPNLVHAEGSPEKFLLAIAEPLLDNLIAAERVLPNRHGNVAPVRATVQPHVMGLDAQRVDGAFRQADPLSSSHLAQCDSALTWHGHAAFSRVAPSCSELQVARIRIEFTFAGGDGPDRLQALRRLRQRAFRIEQRRDLPPERRRSK